jgi:hypothetical protein
MAEPIGIKKYCASDRYAEAWSEALALLTGMSPIKGLG